MATIPNRDPQQVPNPFRTSDKMLTSFQGIMSYTAYLVYNNLRESDYEYICRQDLEPVQDIPHMKDAAGHATPQYKYHVKSWVVKIHCMCCERRRLDLDAKEERERENAWFASERAGTGRCGVLTIFQVPPASPLDTSM